MRKISLLLSLCVLLSAQPQIGNTTRVVTTAGTRVQLSTTTLLVRSVVVQAKVANTGNICVGGSTVLCSTGQGAKLTPGASMSFNILGENKAVNTYNLANIWLDSTVNGEGVDVTYVLAN